MSYEQELLHAAGLYVSDPSLDKNLVFKTEEDKT